MTASPLPAIGTPVTVREQATGWKWRRDEVATHLTSGGRPAFTCLVTPGVYVDTAEGEFWTTSEPQQEGTT
jgi:hypothetical protein